MTLPIKYKRILLIMFIIQSALLWMLSIVFATILFISLNRQINKKLTIDNGRPLITLEFRELDTRLYLNDDTTAIIIYDHFVKLSIFDVLGRIQNVKVKDMEEYLEVENLKDADIPEEYELLFEKMQAELRNAQFDFEFKTGYVSHGIELTSMLGHQVKDN